MSEELLEKLNSKANEMIEFIIYLLSIQENIDIERK